MPAGRAGDRDRQSRRRRTRDRGGRAGGGRGCPGGTRRRQCGRCRRARVGPAAAGGATWTISKQETHPTPWPSTRLPISPTVSERLRNVLLGYARISKADGSQALDLQRDALIEAAVKPDHIYEDQASGKHDDRPGLTACLKALREGDVLVVWKLDRLGRDLRHLVNTVQDLLDRGVGLRVLTGQGAQLDTTTASGRLVFGIFAA